MKKTLQVLFYAAAITGLFWLIYDICEWVRSLYGFYPSLVVAAVLMLPMYGVLNYCLNRLDDSPSEEEE